jgi:hypothetical protein
VLLRPAAFPEDTVWLTLALAMLAARALRTVWEVFESDEQRWVTAFQALAVFLLLLFAGLNLAAYASTHDPNKLLIAGLSTVASVVAGLVFIEKWTTAARQLLIGWTFAWLPLLLIVQAGAGCNGRRNPRWAGNCKGSGMSSSSTGRP